MLTAPGHWPSHLALRGIWWPQVWHVNQGQGYELAFPVDISIQKSDCCLHFITGAKRSKIPFLWITHECDLKNWYPSFPFVGGWERYIYGFSKALLSTIGYMEGYKWQIISRLKNFFSRLKPRNLKETVFCNEVTWPSEGADFINKIRV